MKNKKNIERLFQESFKNFEAKPNDLVWESLQKKLAEKKEDKKKSTSTWYKYVGVAAILLLFFVIGKALFNPVESSTSNNVVNTNSKEITPIGNSENKSNFSATSKNKTINTTEISSTKSNEDNKYNNNNSDDQIVESPNLSKDNNSSSIVKANEETSSFNKTNKTSVVTNSTFDSRKNPEDNKNTTIQENSKTNPVLNENIITSSTENRKEVIASDKKVKYGNEFSVESTKANSALKENSTNVSNTIAQNNSKEENIDSHKSEEKVNATHADLINAIIKNDSLQLVDAIAKTEDSTEKEKKVNRWQVYANIAPVYYNTLGSGSHIHEQFNNNRKNGGINTSYGINVGYAINNKITIRAGVNTLNLSYNTTDVVFYENVSGSNGLTEEYRNISFIPSVSDSLNFISNIDLHAQFISPNVGLYNNTSISQRISYIEVPVEIQYNIIETKFNLQFIGGFSTFFLNDNEIYTDIFDNRNYIGKANNINNISFSTNFGIGLGYNFSEAFQFNFEPTFKYQLNAFSDTSGNFKPYILGVYTGLKYKF